MGTGVGGVMRERPARLYEGTQLRHANSLLNIDSGRLLLAPLIGGLLMPL